MTAMRANQARRGDLVVVNEVRTLESPMHGTELQNVVSLGVVRSASRDGKVRSWSTPYTRFGFDPTRKLDKPAAEVYTVSHELIDVDAAILGYRQRRYDNSELVRPFSSLEDAAHFIKLFALERTPA